MTKLRNAVFALAAMLLSTGALAQAVGFTQDSEEVTVPEELFGGGAVELDFADFEDADTPFVPKAKLIFNSATLNAGTEFSVTFALNGATFDERVVNKHFMWGTWGPANSARGGLDCGGDEADDEAADKLVFCEANEEIDFERKNGSNGDSSVTFDITVVGSGGTAGSNITDQAVPGMPTDADTNPGTPDTYPATETRKIVFLIPRVEASGLRAGNAMGVGKRSATVSISIAQPKMGSGDSEVSESIMMGGHCGETEVSDVMGAQVPCPIVEAKQTVSGVSNTKGDGMISLDPDDGRMQLVPEGAVRLSTVQVTTTTDFGDMSGVRDADGDTLPGDFSGVFAGTLAIEVKSDRFQEGDMVYIADGTDVGEEFSISNGVASRAIDLSSGPVNVMYLPSGDAPLTHKTEFTTTASTEFSGAANLNRSATPAKSTLRLQGIDDDGVKAYAIAPVGHTDMSNVRVTCESSAEAGCRVFFECRDQDGMSTFGEAGAAVGPNATARWNQEGIQDALGIDGWEGRLACNVLSTANISVQVLTRSEGVLVNNTSVNE
ncbi:MAG: hypothetical protein OXQ84_17755 [bacterium]|nr:hypothetical protein [bacterium]